MKFEGSICGEAHDLANISFGSDRPIQWELLSDGDRAKSELTEEQCIIETQEGQHFFVRARLQIPIKSTDTSFTWGVWCSLSEQSFIEMSEQWENPERESLGPYFGWLSTKIPEYPDTMFFKDNGTSGSCWLAPHS